MHNALINSTRVIPIEMTPYALPGFGLRQDHSKMFLVRTLGLFFPATELKDSFETNVY